MPIKKVKVVDHKQEPSLEEEIAFAKVVDEVAEDYTNELFAGIVAQLPPPTPEETYEVRAVEAFFEEIQDQVLQRVTSVEQIVHLEKARPLHESLD